VRNAHDQELAIAVLALCGTPYSAIVRNAGTQPGLPASVEALCGKLPAPGAATLLNPKP
jgi:hypothetical protein